jgi:hypothetical protein
MPDRREGAGTRTGCTTVTLTTLSISTWRPAGRLRPPSRRTGRHDDVPKPAGGRTENTTSGGARGQKAGTLVSTRHTRSSVPGRPPGVPRAAPGGPCGCRGGGRRRPEPAVRAAPRPGRCTVESHGTSDSDGDPGPTPPTPDRPARRRAAPRPARQRAAPPPRWLGHAGAAAGLFADQQFNGQDCPCAAFGVYEKVIIRPADYQVGKLLLMASDQRDGAGHGRPSGTGPPATLGEGRLHPHRDRAAPGSCTPRLKSSPPGSRSSSSSTSYFTLKNPRQSCWPDVGDDGEALAVRALGLRKRPPGLGLPGVGG